METKDEKKEMALFKYGIIAPLISNRDKYVSDSSFFVQVASQAHLNNDGVKKYYSVQTIKRWYYAYKAKGFDGLIPSQRSDLGKSRKISNDTINKIKELVQQYPRLTAKGVYRKLISTELSKNDCSYYTVNRIYKSVKLKNNVIMKNEMLRYEAAHVNDIWCADSSFGPYLYDEKGNRTKLCIIAFIDDASRMIMGCKIYDSDNVVNLMATLKSAIKVNGKPRVLNMDNGKNYRSKQMAIIAAKLGISLHYDPIKTPTSKAKVERLFKTMKMQWLSEIDYHSFKNIEEYQASLTKYTIKYNNTIHSSLNGKTPIERKDLDVANIIYINDDKLDNDFLFEIERRVSFDCVVIIDGKEFQTPAKFANKSRVKLKYSFDFSKVLIVDENGNEYEIKPLNKVENSIAKRSKLTEED